MDYFDWQRRVWLRCNKVNDLRGKIDVKEYEEKQFDVFKRGM